MSKHTLFTIKQNSVLFTWENRSSLWYVSYPSNVDIKSVTYPYPDDAQLPQNLTIRLRHFCIKLIITILKNLSTSVQIKHRLYDVRELLVRQYSRGPSSDPARRRLTLYAYCNVHFAHSSTIDAKGSSFDSIIRILWCFMWYLVV